MRAYVIKTERGEYLSTLSWLLTNGLHNSTPVISKANFYDSLESACLDRIADTDTVFEVEIAEQSFISVSCNNSTLKEIKNET